MLSRGPVILSFSALALFSGLYGAACSSSDTGSSSTATTGAGGHSGTPGGSIEGPADAHCAGKSQVTNAASCHPEQGTTGAGGSITTSSGSGTGTTTGTTGAGGGDDNEYGETLLNAEGDDDDCKYHLKWTASDIYENTDVTFTAVVTTLSDGKPLATGELEIEAYLNDTHPAPNSDAKVTESPTGTYKIGPVRFDKAGKWTVRFHIHEDCSDLSEDSPHGHVAFFVNVP